MVAVNWRWPPHQSLEVNISTAAGVGPQPGYKYWLMDPIPVSITLVTLVTSTLALPAIGFCTALQCLRPFLHRLPQPDQLGSKPLGFGGWLWVPPSTRPQSKPSYSQTLKQPPQHTQKASVFGGVAAEAQGKAVFPLRERRELHELAVGLAAVSGCVRQVCVTIGLVLITTYATLPYPLGLHGWPKEATGQGRVRKPLLTSPLHPY